MAEGERKKIAELYFEYNKALQGLTEIDKKLKEVSEHSETYFDKIQTNLNNSFKLNTINIDTSKIDKELKNTANVSQKTFEKMVVDANKKILNVEETREKVAIREEARNKRLANSSKSMYDKIADYAKTYLIYQGFNILRQQASELVQEMVNVQYQMVQIDRVLNDNSLNIDNYRDKLIQLAYDYGNSFDNVADITLRLAQAGFDAQESLALTEKTLLALNTAELNATQATSDMVAIMSQWNLMQGDANEKSENYGKIIDRINKVADNFPTTSEDILNALKKTSSAFNLAGASIDETIALITTAEIASQRGGKAIGTAMSNIIQQLKEDKKLNIMESMGIDVYTDSTKKEFKSIIDIITQLSEKMQELQAQGKQNSVEMQNLLSVFTVFRRNIGAGLLSGVAGEDSTYAQVLKTSLDSIGYSAEENAKHMKTAKAAQEQFNATLLELKTTVWDNGLEDVFRSMLLLGGDVANWIKSLVDNFGTVPTAIGAATLAFTAFNKQIRSNFSYELGKGFKFDNSFLQEIKNAQKEVDKFQNYIRNNITMSSKDFSDTFKKYTDSIKDGEVSTNGYIKSLIKMKAGTIAAEAATLALNAALSLGLSAGITLILTGLDNLIHAEEKAREKAEEAINTTQENIDKREEEINNIDDLISKYNELSSIPENERTEEQITELGVIQEKITEQLKIQNKYVESMNGNYDEQINKLREISDEKIKQQIEDQKSIIEQQKEVSETGLNYSWKGPDISNSKLKKAGIDIYKDFAEILNKEEEDLKIYSLGDLLNQTDLEQEIKLLEKWQKQLNIASKQGKDVSNELTFVSSSLSELREEEQKVISAQENLNDLLGEQQFRELIGDKDINTVEEYRELLNKISKLKPNNDYTGSVKEFREEVEELARKAFPELEKQSNFIFEENFKNDITNLATELETLSSQFDMVTKAAEEFNTYGSISASTFKSIAENGLIDYLDVVNGKMVVNSQHFADAAENAKQKAIADLQEQAAAQILQIVTNDLNGTLEETKIAGGEASAGISQATQSALNSAQSFIQGKIQATEYLQALKKLGNQNIGDISKGLSETAKKDIEDVFTQLDKNTAKINALAGSVTKASRAASSGSKSNTKTFEEQSQERVKIFKKEIDDLESLEQSWVNKYKKLELFSTSDLKFITHQRINRYNEYLNQINQLTGISEQDRTDLIREYSSKRQEAELEYFDLLKQQLDDQIKALKEANEERIKQIEDAADAEIDALQKVEDENDRIREKEEYERKRQELIYGYEGIEYWKQRTGREAQLALAEAEKQLEDLDRDWEEKKEGWNLDDQIKEIEDARDAQVKAIEDAQEKQIEAWEAAYKKQVELYAETGQIIYDDSIINAGYLYNAYMDNFVSPLNIRLRDMMSEINNVNNATDAASQKVANLSSQAQNVANQVQSVADSVQRLQSQVLQSSPVNQQSGIGGGLGSTGGSLASQLKKRAGRFHGGGKVGTNTEAIAIVRPNEVVLTPEWAAGLDKLVAQVNKGETITNNSSSVNNSITVDGNLINLEGVKFNSREDAKIITDVVEKVLRNKYNIKK